MLLIGSRAFARHGKVDRPMVDYDLIGRKTELPALMRELGPGAKLSASKNGGKVVVFASDKIVEFEIAWPGTTAEDLLSILNVPDSSMADASVADLNTLYALKMSHRFAVQKAFHKTMADIKAMRSMGATIPASLDSWFKRRQTETLSKPHSLATTKSGFFDSRLVKYKYDHDSLHEAVALDGYPAYKDILKDGEEVFCDKAKFDALPHRRKMHTVVEESAVLALERSIIPFGTEPDVAYRTAVERVCTNIASGWWREFAWENFEEAISCYPTDLLERFNEGINNKTIKSFTSSPYASA